MAERWRASTRFDPALAAPIGPLSAGAGAKTGTVWNGYMGGAVRSGSRVADEILAQLS
ncbi:FAD-dependent oxidoreductase [Streptomyces sp. NPDC058084]|uniref:FAD-dependent oxidoreductase n=1 Tax=Streptomyces sp. NPDC058084 TaxID=3346333 RepID=UPI0036EFB427